MTAPTTPSPARAPAAAEIDAAGLPSRALNERVRAALKAGAPEIVLRRVGGQRYIGAGLAGGARIVVEGVPGNDLACFMAGPRIEVRGNAQDGVGNTMGGGSVVIHGQAGDVLGYSMRGGRIFVRGNAGYRVGIHMKAYRDRSPVVIVGGTVRAYFGEYMAGGTLAVLGIGRAEGEPLAGDFIGTGMHGGEIYLRGSVEPRQLGREVGAVAIDDAGWERFRPHLEAFAQAFGLDAAQFPRASFTRLKPVSHRPYGKIYVH
jgi:glutamate synthase domain-containing protein 3